MSKKWIITISIAIVVLASVLISFWTLFGLSSVSINFKSTTKNLTVTEEEIVEAGEFRLGASVLFEGKKKSIDKINEKAKKNENFAYIRVINIETIFPNKFVVHIAEREELFAIKINSQYLVCDRDLRVLKVLDSFESETENPILVEGLTITSSEVQIGDFLSVEEECLKKFYSVMLQNNRSLAQQIGKFKQISLSKYQDEITSKEYISMKLVTFEGKEYQINNPDFAFASKVQKMFAVESTIYSHDLDGFGNLIDKNGQIIYVEETEGGEYVLFNEEIGEPTKKVPLSKNLISDCIIKIDNFTLTEHINRSENDIYYSFVKK